MFLSRTHIHPRKKKFSSRPQETNTTNLYTRVSRCTTIDILLVGWGKKTETETERKKQHSFPIRKEY